MNKTIPALALLLLIQFSGLAQKNRSAAVTELKIPMTAERWEFQPQKVEFLEYKSVPAMRILARNEQAVLKDFHFSNGTIEFDMEPEDRAFAGIYFRRTDKQENEYFYLRTGDAGNPQAIDAVQYAPIVKGVLLWDMLPWYQGPASFKKQQWNHIKLVVSGAEMLVYVNDLNRPTLEIPRLEGNNTDGGLAFDGMGYIANLVIRPGVTEGLSPAAGFDPTHSDPRYLRTWAMSPPVSLSKGRELSMDDLPKTDSGWEKIEAERRGLVNLTRVYGKSEARRMVWLKARLKVSTQQQRRVAFGFSDEVWVFLNNKLLFADKNIYIAPIRKEPDGRCSIENAAFSLPLEAGVNELLIGVSNDFYGWGIIARLDTMEGIELLP
jgi:hypothetical protein